MSTRLLGIAILAMLIGVSAADASIVADKGTSGVNNFGTTANSVSITNLDAALGQNSLRTPIGNTEFMSIGGDITDLDMSGSGFTVMAWIRVLSGTGGSIIGLGNCCGGNAVTLNNRQGYTLNLTSDGSLRYWGGSNVNNSNYNAYSSESNLDNGGWHHVAARVNSNGIQLFVNGNSSSATIQSDGHLTSPSLATPSALSSNVPKIGGRGISTNDASDMLIDEIRVYGSYLGDTEIMAAMNGGGPAPDRLYYDFEEDTQVVPEPSALAIWSLVTLAIGFVIRRRRRS